MSELSPEEIAAVSREIVIKPSARKVAAAHSSPAVHWPTTRQWLLIGWLGGALVLLGRTLLASARLCSLLRRYEPVSDPAVLELLEKCEREMGVAQKPILLAGDSSCVPALVGFWRPRLLMPVSVLRDFDRRELRLIFLHELGHLRRRDVAINWIVAGLQILHWFNPVLWLAFARLRVDRELACDELVLSIAQQQERRAYGQTMIKLLQTLFRGTVLPGLVGILEGTHPMRRRISMIAQFDGKQRWTSLALLSVMGLAAISLTDGVHGQATEPKPPVTLDTTAPGAPGTGVAPGATPTVVPSTGDPRRTTPLGTPGGRAGSPAPAAEGGGGGYTQRQRPNPYGGQPGGYGGGYGNLPGGPAGYYTATRNPAGLGGGDEKANVATEKILKQVMPEVRFEAVGLSDVIDFLRDASGLNIFVDWKAMADAGVDQNVAVTMRLKNVPVREALRLAIRNAGQNVTFTVENGIVVIGVSDGRQVGVTIKGYDINDLIGGTGDTALKSKELVDLITETVGNFAGSTVAIKAFNGKLIVTADEATHKDVDKVLSMLHNDQEMANPKAAKSAGPIP